MKMPFDGITFFVRQAEYFAKNRHTGFCKGLNGAANCFMISGFSSGVALCKRA
jgi:hypothetical protein